MFALLAFLTANPMVAAEIRPLLHQQGFDDLLNGRETIDYVGAIRQGSSNYKIYVYKGVFRAAAVDHGVNRLIIVLNEKTVLGSYKIPMATRCKVESQSIVCATEAPGVVPFTRKGPPREIWFDGEVIPFEYGNWFKGDNAVRR